MTNANARLTAERGLGKISQQIRSGHRPERYDMKHERKFRDDDYYDSPDRSRKDKGRDRRRKGEADVWAELVERAENPDEPVVERRQPTPAPQQQRPAEGGRGTWQAPFQMNQEATVEIKGFKIDLSRVDHLTKLDTTYNGKPSHGIEFAFFGKRGLGRTIWYGTNAKQRDEEYARYEAIRAKAAESRK